MPIVISILITLTSSVVVDSPISLAASAKYGEGRRGDPALVGPYSSGSVPSTEGSSCPGGGGGGPGGGNAFGGSPAEIVISGPDSGQLQSLADTIQSQLDSMEQVSWARVTVRPGSAEFWIEPVYSAFVALGLNFNDILPTLNLAGREGETMQTGFVTGSGRELPLVIERVGARDETGARADLSRLRLQTPAGVVPVASLATIRQMPAPPVIAHHNGRREISVMYGLSDQIPETGPPRILIEEQIADAVRAIPKPQGVSIETLEENDAVSLCLLYTSDAADE